MNIIFILLGAYGLSISAIFFSSYSMNDNSTALIPIPQEFIYVFAYAILFASIAFIMLAFGFAWLNFSEKDKNFVNKFEKKYSLIKANSTQKNCIYCNIDYKDFSIHLKQGNELIEHNKQLYEMTTDLLENNNSLVNCIVESLICFIIFIALIKNSMIYVLCFSIILMFIVMTVLVSFRKNKVYRKSNKK